MASPPLEYAELRRLVTTQPAPEAGRSCESLFETRVTAISRLALAANLDSLVTILRNAQPKHLQRAVVEAKTINETSFFRDTQPFDMLRTRILPRLITTRRAERRLRIWSAACSTGQEAYSVALMLSSNFPELLDWDVKIIGTDLSDLAIAYAANGTYRRCEVERGLTEEQVERYFMRQGDCFQVRREVQRLCEFHVADLGGTLPPLPQFDLILLRNVLLYFPPAERPHLLKTMHLQLAPDGFLMLGNAEQAEDSTHLFEVETGQEAHLYRPIAVPSESIGPRPRAASDRSIH